MKYFFIFLVCISCGTAHKLAKAKRLIEEAKAEGAQVKHDTIFQEKKVLVKGEAVTNIVYLKKDTTIYKTIDRVKIREVIKRDTLWQKINCPDSVIKVRVPYYVKEEISPKEKNNFWLGFAIGTLALAAVAIVLKKLIA